MSAPDASDFQASAPSQRGWILLAGAGSATVFLAALGYQYLGGLLPCAMCLWQRWPHRIAMALTLIGVLRPSNGIVALGVASMLVSAGLGVFHTGVERSWWEGPQSCAATASQDLGAMSGAELLDFTTGPQIEMCVQRPVQARHTFMSPAPCRARPQLARTNATNIAVEPSTSPCPVLCPVLCPALWPVSSTG